MNLQDVKVVNKKLADGTVKKYYYRRSTMTRIEGEPGSLLFKLNWERAGGVDGESKPGEFAELIQRYRQAPENQGRTADHVKDRDRYMKMISDEFGHFTLNQLQDDQALSEFYDWRDSRAEFPTAADRGVNYLVAVLNWAKKRRIIRINQAEGMVRLITKREKVRRDRSKILWEGAWLEGFFKHSQPWLQNAYYLAYYTGARKHDICKLRWDMIDEEGWLSFTPSKTSYSSGTTVHLPTFALPAMREFLGRLPRLRHGYILASHRGKPLNPFIIGDGIKYLKHNHLGDQNVNWHDIRGTTITHLFEAGCTNAEVASISGHKIVQSSEAGSLNKYASISRNMALSAYTKWAKVMQVGSETTPGN